MLMLRVSVPIWVKIRVEIECTPSKGSDRKTLMQSDRVFYHTHVLCAIEGKLDKNEGEINKWNQFCYVWDDQLAQL